MACQYKDGLDVSVGLPQLHDAGEHTIADLADLFSVSRPTVYRVLDRVRTQAAGAAAAT